MAFPPRRTSGCRWKNSPSWADWSSLFPCVASRPPGYGLHFSRPESTVPIADLGRQRNTPNTALLVLTRQGGSTPRRLPPCPSCLIGATEHTLATAQVDARALVIPLAWHVVDLLALTGDVALGAASAGHGWRGHLSLAGSLVPLAAPVVRGHLERPLPEVAPLLARIGFVCDERRRVLAIRDRPTGSHHPPVDGLPLDEALGHHSAVAVRVLRLAANGLVQHIAVQRGGGAPTAGPRASVLGGALLGAFRGIDAPQADALLRHREVSPSVTVARPTSSAATPGTEAKTKSKTTNPFNTINNDFL